MKKNAIKIIVFSVAVSGAIFFLYFNNYFFGWQTSFTDKLFLTRPASSSIVIIAIDSSSINKFGRWPWDRKIHSDIINKICKQKPAVLGIDINFSERSDFKNDQELAQSIDNCSSVVLPITAEITLARGNAVAESLIFPLPELVKSSTLGIANTPLDQDGIFRKSLIELRNSENATLTSFAMAVAREYGKTSMDKIPVDEQGRMIVNFSGTPGHYKTISAYNFLSGKQEATLYGKIVLFGATAPDLHDNYMVPTSCGVPMSGVEIHANTINTIIDNIFLEPANNYLQAGIIFLLILLICLCMFKFELVRGTIFVLVVAFFYVVIALVSFERGFVLDMFYPLFSILLSYLSIVIFRNLTDVREKRKIRKAFSCYVSPEVIEEILVNPQKLKLGGESQRLSILFSDIRGFTSISEKLSPHDLVAFLNDYLSIMSDLIMKERGVVDKYIGDAIMAFWGAPISNNTHAVNSCQAALDMISKLEENTPRWENTYGFTPNIGIGINTGNVIVGNVGSDKRFDYTVMGDAVNLASRLESLTKKYKVRIIISEYTKIETENKFVYRYLDKVVVKGKKESVNIYELINTPEKVNFEENKIINKFNDAVMAYQAQNWVFAKKMFEEIKKEKGEDELVNMYLQRIQEMQNNPPEKEWDGTFVLAEK